MSLRTEHLNRCFITLEKSLVLLGQAPADSVDYEIYRNAVVNGFELTLETAGQLLLKAIKTYSANPRSVDRLTYKEVLRHAAKHDLLDTAQVERCFVYRDNRNNTAHDYGVKFAQETLVLLTAFIDDARLLETTLREEFGDAAT